MDRFCADSDPKSPQKWLFDTADDESNAWEISFLKAIGGVSKRSVRLSSAQASEGGMDGESYKEGLCVRSLFHPMGSLQ